MAIAFGIGIPLVLWAIRKEPSPRVRRLLALAALAKVAATLLFVAFGDVYVDDTIDASAYDRVGADLAPFFQEGVFSVDLGRGIVGTGSVGYLVGLIYAVTGRSLLGAALIFSMLALWGQYLLARAGQRTLAPHAATLFSGLVLLWPSMIFWPSGLGKDAIVLFGLGVSTYGLSKIVTGVIKGWLYLCTGMGVVLLVRPHVALLVGLLSLTALLASVLKTSTKVARTGLFPAAIGIVGVALAIPSLSPLLQAYLGLEEEVSREAIEDVIDRRGVLSARGASTFTAMRVDSPTDIAVALPSVLLRPYPWEARGVFQLAASLEGVLLALLFGSAVLRRGFAWSGLRGNPLLLGACAYVVASVVAFSSIGNFGLLTRQRAQVIPFVLLIVSQGLARPRRSAAKTGGRVASPLLPEGLR